VFEPRENEVTGGWGKLNNEELRNFCSSPSIRMVKSRRIRWTGPLVRIRGKEKKRERGEICIQVTGENARKKETIRKIKT
jgi:hypothetical protein